MFEHHHAPTGSSPNMPRPAESPALQVKLYDLNGIDDERQTCAAHQTGHLILVFLDSLKGFIFSRNMTYVIVIAVWISMSSGREHKTTHQILPVQLDRELSTWLPDHIGREDEGLATLKMSTFRSTSYWNKQIERTNLYSFVYFLVPQIPFKRTTFEGWRKCEVDQNLRPTEGLLDPGWSSARQRANSMSFHTRSGGPNGWWLGVFGFSGWKMFGQFSSSLAAKHHKNTGRWPRRTPSRSSRWPPPTLIQWDGLGSGLVRLWKIIRSFCGTQKCKSFFYARTN